MWQKSEEEHPSFEGGRRKDTVRRRKKEARKVKAKKIDRGTEKWLRFRHAGHRLQDFQRS